METTPVSAPKRTIKARTGKPAESKPGKVAVDTKPKPKVTVARAWPPAKAIAEPAAATPVKIKSVKTRAIKVSSKPATTAAVAHSEAEILHMIAEAAYFMAEHRHFEPGHETQDWLIAEQQIRSQYQHA